MPDLDPNFAPPGHVAVEGGNCEGCAYLGRRSGGPCPSVPCTDVRRPDGKAVIFKPQATPAPIGYCPHCKSPSIWWGRGGDGWERCANGHQYTSSSALPSFFSPEGEVPRGIASAPASPKPEATLETSDAAAPSMDEQVMRASLKMLADEYADAKAERFGGRGRGYDDPNLFIEARRKLHSLIASLPLAQVEVPPDCDVRKIVVAITPGADGTGQEVYARNNADVEQLLTDQDAQLEELETQARALAAQATPAVSATPAVGSVGWMKVRIDTAPNDGACFATPARHPEDVAKGLGEFDDDMQVFGLVVAAHHVGAIAEPIPDRFQPGAADEVAPLDVVKLKNDSLAKELMSLARREGTGLTRRDRAVLGVVVARLL